MAITNQIAVASDYWDEAIERKKTWGVTNAFSTGYEPMDKYLGGGYGRTNGYEIVLVFGPTKIGKSYFTLNLIAEAIKRGQKVGLMSLEDDAPDVVVRLADILGTTDAERFLHHGQNVHVMPPEAMDNMWKLEELLSHIESWYVDRKMDIIVLDHLQFAFENAEAIKGENEWVSQRVFMKKLNVMVRKLNKTIILVSHINKSTATKGVDKVVGSGGIAAGATKILGLSKDDDGVMELMLHGSRFTSSPNFAFRFKYDDAMKIKDVF